MANADFDAALQIDLAAAGGLAEQGRRPCPVRRARTHCRWSPRPWNGTRKPALAYFVRAMGNEDSGHISAAYHDLQRARQLDPKWDEPRIELQRFQVRQL
jgi:hypothetical protein